MTDREKLTNILWKAWAHAEELCACTACCECPSFPKGAKCMTMLAADNLIANGVTFAKDTAKNDTSVDTVEVVRCRDCKYRKTERCQMYWESEDGREQYNWETDDDFCSSGKRRDNG